MGTNSLCCASKRGKSCEAAWLPRKTVECLGDRIRWGKGDSSEAGGPGTNTEKHLLLWEWVRPVAQRPFSALPPVPREGGATCLPAHAIHSASALGWEQMII